MSRCDTWAASKCGVKFSSFPFPIFPSFYFSFPDSSSYFSVSENPVSFSLYRISPLSLMAETSYLSFSPFPCVPSISRSREPSSSLPAFTPSPKSSVSRPRPSRLLRFAAKASDSGNSFAEESFGFFPWNDGDSEIQWVPEERVTLLTTDGLIQIGGSMVPRRVSSSDKKQGRSKAAQRFQRFQERDYMDPKQGLCLGALFDIAATNGLDMGRRLCIFGFCRSIEMLSDVVEDTVLEHGGEVCHISP
ncbi:hypothetical protein FH972_017623 [Carpinus fangiana]|uniref:DUF7811 domain-containing protein n=1 Tax=Carpinus fangiana TaxID=176857 RepID=A0A5N6RJG2_9ROSI|nr:hypothetical protein FH972_017623 [Carpinus fangiana]KAE8099663.1 hypothetical protein FH972_017623 [Carpinus fangiana]